MYSSALFPQDPVIPCGASRRPMARLMAAARMPLGQRLRWLNPLLGASPWWRRKTPPLACPLYPASLLCETGLTMTAKMSRKILSGLRPAPNRVAMCARDTAHTVLRRVIINGNSEASSERKMIIGEVVLVDSSFSAMRFVHITCVQVAAFRFT